MLLFQAWYKTHVGTYQGGVRHGLENEQLGSLKPEKVVRVAQDGSWEGDGLRNTFGLGVENARSRDNKQNK